jgi:hypothetical protein
VKVKNFVISISYVWHEIEAFYCIDHPRAFSDLGLAYSPKIIPLVVNLSQGGESKEYFKLLELINPSNQKNENCSNAVRRWRPKSM